MLEFFFLVAGLSLGAFSLNHRVCTVDLTDPALDTDDRVARLKPLGLMLLIAFGFVALASGAFVETHSPMRPAAELSAVVLGAALFGFAAPFARGGIVGLFYRAGAGRLHALAALVIIALSASFTHGQLLRSPRPWSENGFALPVSVTAALPETISVVSGVVALAIAVTLLFRADRAAAPPVSAEAGKHTRRRRWVVVPVGAAFAFAVVGRVIVSALEFDGAGNAAHALNFEVDGFRYIVAILDAGPARGWSAAASLLGGVLLGATAESLRTKSFKLTWPKKAEPITVLIAALVMGIGLAFAGGATLTHIYAGTTALSPFAFVFVLVSLPAMRAGHLARARFEARLDARQKRSTRSIGFRPSRSSKKKRRKR